MTVASTFAQRDHFISVARQMSNWVDQVLGPNYHRFGVSEAWVPCINIYEDQDHYCVVVDLAGLKAEQIDLHVEKGVMTISGERPAPLIPEIKGQVSLHLMEIDHGRFCRALKLPDNVDIDTIPNAFYRNGYLWVRMPKTCLPARGRGRQGR